MQPSSMYLEITEEIMVGKGSKRRPENVDKFQKGYNKIFGKHTLKAIRSLKNYNQGRANNGR